MWVSRLKIPGSIPIAVNLLFFFGRRGGKANKLSSILWPITVHIVHGPKGELAYQRHLAKCCVRMRTRPAE